MPSWTCLECGVTQAVDLDEDGLPSPVLNPCADECGKLLCRNCPKFQCDHCGQIHCQEHKIDFSGDVICPCCMAGVVDEAARVAMEEMEVA